MTKPEKISGPLREVIGKKWKVEHKGHVHYCKTERSALKYIKKKGW